MCRAAARLSRRRMCASSCAKIASICSSLRRALRLRGHSKIGLRTPNTPGSSEMSDERRGNAASRRRRISNSRPLSTTVALRTAVATRRQRATHVMSSTAHPAIQIASRTTGSAGHGAGASVSRATTARNSVDCQRWFASNPAKAGSHGSTAMTVISLSPSWRAVEASAPLPARPRA